MTCAYIVKPVARGARRTMDTPECDEHARGSVSAGPAPVLLLVLVAAEATAERPPIPEPILAETITDIDAPTAGEIELELNSSYLRARRGGAYELEVGPEIEWLATDRLGTMLELFGGRDAAAEEPSTSRFGASVGLSWKLLHAFAQDFHLQAEARGRFPTDLATAAPGESAQPLSTDLLAALRAGRWTFRSSIGVSIGRAPAHVPLRGSAVILTDLGEAQRNGFWGLEATADGAKVAPFALALDLVPDLTRAGLPFRLGLVGSYSFGAPATLPSWGVFIRAFIESRREADLE
jgi:hypothetical protein